MSLETRALYAAIGRKFEGNIKFDGCPTCKGSGQVPYESYDGHRTDRGMEQCGRCDNKANERFFRAARVGMRAIEREEVEENDSKIKTKAEDF